MHIKYTSEISIEQVLTEMKAAPGRVFWLAFVRATGKDRGTVKVVSRCRYGAVSNESVSGEGMSLQQVLGEKSRKWLHVDKGTLPLTDHDSGAYITPLISHLIGYNLKKIIH